MCVTVCVCVHAWHTHLCSLHLCCENVVQFKEDDSKGKDVNLLVIQSS